ncbi:MAG: nitrite/sulfite reductase [Acidimicrobiales bacterium]|nr:nitrite/sulfite reductase [Hyphomonadaceae bacterium]RZV38508.1 MAG: nitrite/sulfite reductase [Acidimicrobiales bacterium]
MYRYDEFDHEFVRARTRQFRGQVERRLKGTLTEDQFKPLRLMNGLYLQLHAYMLRVAIPYGTFNATQMRQLAMIADKYDRGYGHITTRQNIQFNWPELVDVPDILDDLADVEMHAIQTSGNCIRNVTSDPWAGAAADELEDPRATAELLRQWSSLHPEFTYLPRKFKIAVIASQKDRAVLKAHDIGIQIIKNDLDQIGYKIFVGGGLGRTPIIGKELVEFLPRIELLPYLEATMRVYNRYGRRDNKYKARIKILVTEMGIDAFKAEVDDEYSYLSPSDIAVSKDEIARITSYFAPPAFENLASSDADYERARRKNIDFARWAQNNVARHKVDGYAIVNISLKPIDGAPGDITSAQMRVVADLAEKYSFGEIRATHEQNLVLPYVKKSDLFALYMSLQDNALQADNIGLITDIICCPGMDYCALATARSIPVSQAIAERFSDPVRQQTIGEMKIKISGCINACGHHHVGHIGILGLEKAGVESYQIKLGGDGSETAAIGDVTGKGFSQDELIDAIERVVDLYLNNRNDNERFVDTYRRIGMGPFKEVLYDAA